MKTFSITYKEIIDYENLCGANIDAKECKTERNEVMRFNMELDENLIDLYEDLQAKRYKQRGYRLIYITAPKKRVGFIEDHNQMRNRLQRVSSSLC